MVLWFFVSSILSFYGQEKTLNHLTDQIALHDRQVIDRHPHLSPGMVLFLQGAWDSQSFFWVDGERLSHILRESLKDQGHIRDYIWTHNPLNATSHIGAIFAGPKGENSRENLQKNLKKYFPHAVISIKTDKTLGPDQMDYTRVDLTFNRGKNPL